MAGDYKTREERRKIQQSSKKKTKNKRSIFKKIFLFAFLFGLVGLLTGGGLFAYYVSKAPSLDEAILKDTISSEIYDMNGELVTKIGSSENRKYVEFDEIPDTVVDAIIATEDSRFFEHFGIDPIRLGGAVIANVTRGFGSEGASTITQQVVKNYFFSSDKTLERKAQEAWLALQLEQEYTKEQIFEMYVNKILMGGRIYGIATASEYYYGKELSELELHEAAQLAGMPQSPNNYNPFVYPEEAQERRDIVLQLMNQHGKISEEEMNKAMEIDVKETLVQEEERLTAEEENFDNFIFMVIEDVEKQGYDLSDGLKIYTTLDTDAQTYVNKVLTNEEMATYVDREELYTTVQSGVSLLDTQTGAIRAVGSRSGQEDVEWGYNFATQASLQPGSAIKPLLDYAPAIEFLNWSTYHIIDDAPYEGPNDWTPYNWDNKFKGPITTREAIWDSRNIPAIKAYKEVGADNAKEFINRLGIDMREYFESAAIGGVEGTSEMKTSPLQMAGAYAAFGSGGIYNKPHSITRIEFRDGSEVDLKPEPVIAMKDYTAYMITDMLKSVVEHPGGSGNSTRISGLPLVGKSGTTNFDEDQLDKFGFSSKDAPDSWFVGYTSNYTLSVWVGYDDKTGYLTPEERREITQKGIFKNIMSHVSEGVETADFKKPASVVESPVEIGTNPAKLPSDHTPSDKITYELFVKGTQPTSTSSLYDKLDAPENLEIKEKKDNTIELKWKYGKSKKDIEFIILSSMDGGPLTEIAKTTKKSVTIDNLQPGSQYQFQVLAVSDLQESEPASISYELPGVEEEPIEDPLDDLLDDLLDGDTDTDEGTENDGTEGEGGSPDDETGNPDSETGDTTEEPLDDNLLDPNDGNITSP
ncbi:PBP1A family penicillin-binding protein [Bacillus spongiae]|uniref:PBP1A family penicillin-binding protein n=1 Tax=Bacillus spongiae TaxID=2683610 RepID=A0ABU8HD05_9BACI